MRFWERILRKRDYPPDKQEKTSLHKYDYLLTWNCQHLANANKFEHIRRLNAILGLFVPALVTPLELLGTEQET